MITCILQGGLGNQLFQISAAYSLVLGNNDELFINPNEHYLPLQGRCVNNYQKTVFRNIKFSEALRIETTYHEPFFHYQQIPYRKNQKLIGYFQSEKYFKEHKEDILNLFRIDENSQAYIEERYSEIFNTETTVSIHVRRGDFLKLKNVHPPCSKEYYTDAVAHFPTQTMFFVFSDDVEWCKNNFKQKQFKIIEENDIISLYLMTMCGHNIIANSSFSWWGAWLNENPDKNIIAPKKWFGNNFNNTEDLIPSEWLTM